MSTERQHLRRHESLPHTLANRLRHSIARGDMKPGEKLPTEQMLCDTFGVSRAVVREALSLLKSEGLVISHQGRGQFVNPNGSSVFRLQPNFDDREDLAQLFEFLMALEVAASQLAAERRTESELEEIHTRLLDLERAIEEERSGVDEDMEFHRAILRATHNSYYMDFGDFLEGQVRRLIRTARANTARYAGLVEHVQEEHTDIYKAIEKGDPDAAGKTAATHLYNAAARLRLYRSGG